MLGIKTILLLNKNLTNFDKSIKIEYKFAEKFTLREKQGQKFRLNSKKVDCMLNSKKTHCFGPCFHEVGYLFLV